MGKPEAIAAFSNDLEKQEDICHQCGSNKGKCNSSMLARILAKIQKGQDVWNSTTCRICTYAVCLQLAMQILYPARINTQVAYFNQICSNIILV